MLNFLLKTEGVGEVISLLMSLDSSHYEHLSRRLPVVTVLQSMLTLFAMGVMFSLVSEVSP